MGATNANAVKDAFMWLMRTARKGRERRLLAGAGRDD